MRLYGAICKVTSNSDGTLRVEGIASSEAEDDQGETIRAAAMRAAIPDYMKYPALREMHQLSAAGTTIEADVGDDGVTRIVARVVDPVAISKVKNQVYRGFSIGGRVTKRDPSNPRIITGIQLAEISLVDRPANPEAQLEVWKASITEGNSDMAGLATLGDLPAGQKLAGVLTEPVQIWHCGEGEHRHTGKAEALRCIEKQAAAGVNGGTQWEPEPLAKGEQPTTTNPAKNIPEIIPEPAAVAESAEKAGGSAPGAEGEAQPEVVDEASEARAASEENPTEKSAVIPRAEETAAEVAEPDTVEHTLEVKLDTPEAPADTAKAAEPSATEQAIAKAAEVAALARAALNLPSAAAEAPVVEETAKANDGDADDKASGDKPKGDYGDDVEYADPGYQSDGKPRYPVDTAEHVRAAWSYINQEKNHKGYTAEQVAKIKAKIVSAWKSKIDKAGPPSAGKASLPEIFGAAMLSKGLVGTATVIDTVGELDRLSAMLRWQAVHEGGEEIARAAGALPPAAAVLRTLVTAPALEITDEELTELATKTGGITGWIETIRARDFGDLADAIAKAAGRHTAQNQMLIDKAYECATQCAAMDGCTKAMSDHLDAACKMMQAAGAKGYGDAAYAAAEKSVLAGELGIIAKAGGHQALLDLAHFCLASMGKYCPSQKGAAEETGVKAAHDHLCLAGATCSGGATMKATGAEGEDKLAKALQDKDALAKSLGDVVSLVEQLVAANTVLAEKFDVMDEKVTRIDNQELAPRGLARTAGLGITKAQDNGAVNRTSSDAPPLKSVEDIVAAVEAMPPSMEKAFLHMRLAHSDPRQVKVISAAEAGTGAAQ